MVLTTATDPIASEKVAPAEEAGTDKDSATHCNHVFQDQAAATEHALTPLQAMQTYWRAFIWCAFMCIGAVLLGYDAQVCTGLMGIPQFRMDFGSVADGRPILAASWQSAFSSSSLTGAMFGGLLSSRVSDRLGRRGTAASACGVSMVAILIQFLTAKHANWMLLIGKLVNGFAIAMLASCTASYCAEVSPLALRSITTSAVSRWTILGQFVSSGIIRGTGRRTDVYAYRIPLALQWVFLVTLLIGLPFAPESPWWLVRKGRHEEAEKVLIRLGGPTIDAKLQRQQIKETIELEDSYAATATYADCFRGENLKRTVVAMMVFVLQQSTGVIFFLGHSTYFFELARFATSNALNFGVGVSAIGVVGNLLALFSVNCFGRRSLFNWGMITCSTILFLIASAWIWDTSQNVKWAISVFMIVYSVVYQTSIGPLAYVMFAEISSAKLRSKTVCIAIWTNALCGMIASIVNAYSVNPEEGDLGGYVGFVYGSLSLAGTIWAYFFIPETKGRSVDELDLLYEKRVPARHFATYLLYDGVRNI